MSHTRSIPRTLAAACLATLLGRALPAQVEEAVLVPDVPGVDARTGSSVAIDGTTAACGIRGS